MCILCSPLLRVSNILTMMSRLFQLSGFKAVSKFDWNKWN